MTAPVFQYVVHHPVTRQRLGMLDVRQASWSETVGGGSTFTGQVTVPEDQYSITHLKYLTEPDRTALYVTVPDRAQLCWSGPIVGRKWDDGTNSLTITAIDWRSWFYTILFGPKPDGTDVNLVSYTGKDQLELARAIVTQIQSLTFDPQGLPLIEEGDLLYSGILRDLQILGLDFKSPGAYMDSIAALNGGFEWDLLSYYASDGRPRLRLQTYFPQQGGVVDQLRFTKTPEGGNILNLDEVDFDATGASKRVWAVGEGPNAESTPWAVDSDPELAPGAVLRRDVADTYSNAPNRAFLAAYARGDRLMRAQTLEAVSFNVRMDDPDMFGYGKGDRCRVTIRDRFLDIDLDKCRILTREFSPDINTVKVTVNLVDRRPLEIDVGSIIL